MKDSLIGILMNAFPCKEINQHRILDPRNDYWLDQLIFSFHLLALASDPFDGANIMKENERIKEPVIDGARFLSFF